MHSKFPVLAVGFFFYYARQQASSSEELASFTKLIENMVKELETLQHSGEMM
ncbi:hypothetical protein [Paenibacillus maysiensis]|uniref:hypothetical protein n=1 Tax=Paenibacillus maysiensis TaxID=1155954 RepID=UPI0004AD5BA2|nr:hypothetical protein [Paenibacillus maysiensis]